MRCVLLIAALIPTAALEAQVPKQTNPKCVKPSSRAIAGDKRIGPKKLGEMPPAKQYLAVLREVDGCPTPVVLREVQPTR